MHLNKLWAAVAAFGYGLVNATPVARQGSGLDPCANITMQLNMARAANATQFYADGELAYACLNSMPFDSARASEFIVQATKYLQFQSTLSQLKNPPKTYLSPGVDLLAGMQWIYNKANNSGYQSQYQFDTDVQNLWNSANDGHLFATLCSLTAVQFTRSEIVSISTDGVSIPKVYLATDAILAARSVNASVSNIILVNGEDVTQYLKRIGAQAPNQDPDAQWNDIFPSSAKYVAGSSDGAVGAFSVNTPQGLWPGSPVTTFTFANGSTMSTRVQASTMRGWNYTDGTQLYRSLCLPRTTTATNSSSTSTTPSQAPTATAGPSGYGKAIARDPYNKIIGYYLNSTQFNDTAVLFIPSFSFEELPDWEEAKFAEVASSFVNQSRADGKTKMIIDVSGNPGGTITAGFDLFKLFFPQMLPYSATRMRVHPLQTLSVKSLASLNETLRPDLGNTDPFYYYHQVTPNQTTRFTSWQQLYSPNLIQGSNMSSLYANYNYTFLSSASEPIRGYYDVPLNVSGQPFRTEDILIVSDGFCQSTCTTFVNLMTNFGGVKSLAFGGRPNSGPMQIMGGVRGAQSYGWSSIYSVLSGAYEVALNTTNTTTPSLTQQEMQQLKDLAPLPLTQFPLRFPSASLNLRNSYNPNDTHTPLQFSYQAANCRLFYTNENGLNPPSAWLSAARAWWGNGTCVAGSRS